MPVSTEITLDPQSQRWLTELAPGSPHRDGAIERLHTLLVKVSRHELGRRRSQLGAVAGPEFDDLAQQAANDALLAILAKLDDFRGLSRFTTWAYKFALVQVSGKVAGHAWRYRPPGLDDLGLEQLPDLLTPRPGEQVEQREQLAALTRAIGELTPRQREVFVAVTLNEVPMDVLALRLDTNRNAIYKNLFDARASLRQKLAAAGHPVSEEAAR